MQTFLPHPNFFMSANILDSARLRNQPNEALVIHSVLTGNTDDWKDPDAWSNHPAVKMWRGYEDALVVYRQAFIGACLSVYNINFKELEIPSSFELPSWLGDERLHESHKASLLDKDYDWYSVYEWSVCVDDWRDDSGDVKTWWPV